MKNLNILSSLSVVLLMVVTTGCEDFLKEESISDVTTDSYVVDETGYEDLVKACYPLLREVISTQGKDNLVLRGTDIFTGGGWKDEANSTGSALDTYDVRMNSSMGDLATFWDILYREIGRTNTAIERAETITYSDPKKKSARVAEAKFLRALSYFYLVQTWGDVPMPLRETKTPSK
ncbi:MAG TPA: RagB/SusD family nutrient uptake outer membrane protein, partial [Chryseosolibacter sp.]|nr:RagB/SusD family nutrient uptake outer membrane protein [Chryseosolibacter sp.]